MIGEKVFAEKVVKEIKSYLPPEYLDVDCEITEVPKNNGVVYVGIIFRKPNMKSSPVIYIEPYYQGIKYGAPINDVMNAIAKAVHDGMQNGNLFVENNISSYDEIKDYLSVKLINTKANKKEITDMPCCNIEDLSLVPIIRLPMPSGNEYGTIKIRNGMLSDWGIEITELYQQIWKNMENQIVLFTLEEKAMEIFAGAPQAQNLLTNPSKEITNSDMLMLSTKSGINGAAAVAYPGLLDKIEELFPEGFYVLPSSVDEVMIVSKNNELEAPELKELVRIANHEAVLKKDILSNSIYQYDKGNGTLCRIPETLTKGKEIER